MASADNQCCRPIHPQLHSPRARRKPLLTITTPPSTQSSCADVAGPAKSLGQSPANVFRAPPAVSLVCRGGVSTVIPGTLAGLFPVLGQSSQIRYWVPEFCLTIHFQQMFHGRDWLISDVVKQVPAAVANQRTLRRSCHRSMNRGPGTFRLAGSPRGIYDARLKYHGMVSRRILDKWPADSG
jgi:hypothetical protein